MEWKKETFTISTDKSKLDMNVIHGYLSKSYWSPDIPMETVKKSIDHCLTFGLFEEKKQIGFAKMITDRATFAYLADVFVLEEYQGRGLGKWLIECVMSHSDLQGLRRIMLATRDAHGLYAAFGFKPLHNPDKFMQLWMPDVYQKIKVE